MQNDLSPDYLRSLVPAAIGCTSSYPLRNASNLQTLHAYAQLCYNSFLPYVVRDWDELQEQTRSSLSLNVFKKRINANVSTPPLYYNTGKRFGQLYYARLRTSCISLRQHLYYKHYR